MADYKIKLAVSAIPLETMSGADGTNKATIVHSQIDRVLSAMFERQCGTSSSSVQLSDVSVTGIPQAIAPIIQGNIGVILFRAKQISGIVHLSIGPTRVSSFKNVGDFAVFTFTGTPTHQMSSFTLSPNGGSDSGTFEILAGI